MNSNSSSPIFTSEFLFTAEQLPPGMVMLVVKSQYGSELAVCIPRERDDCVFDAFHCLLQAIDMHDAKRGYLQ